MKNIDEVSRYVRNNISLEEIRENILRESIVGIDASEIEEKLGIVRNNASTLLNNLCKQGEFIKIHGRPVRFVPKSILENITSSKIIKKQYDIRELKDIMLSKASPCEKNSIDQFGLLIGSDSSLRNQIDQAKAAILYPPNGLHTLILGASGVGKTTFANTMYEFAKAAKNKSTKEFPFASFNCSDYFNNPQLLLSQLFGHVRGAFSGADTDKIGLVERADGGILFLDEVHRLPPDGQEMLFFLMDRGEYHRLGETGTPRKSNVLIISATTEDPQQVLLKTFLRRIPVIITLPSLKDKDTRERIEIIENIFIEEAIRINRKLKICPEVLKALVVYKCVGNIGQLKSDIKLICAKAFLKYLQSEDDLRVEFSILPKFIKDSIFHINKLDLETQKYLNNFEEDLIIYPSKEKHENHHMQSENIYDRMTKALLELKKKGLSDRDIDLQISKEIESYYRSFIKKFNHPDFNIRELYKVIDKELVDFTLELINFASDKLDREFNEKIMFGLAFHLNSLLERVRLKKPIVNQQLSKIKEMYDEEYKIASSIVERISERFHVDIPVDENGFIAILLANNEKENQSDDKIGLLVIAHGMSTATSMANVCNRLLNSNFVKAIDMPLEKSVEEMYNEALTVVKTLDRGKGVLILVDMGSLKTFGDRITEETGIITRTIDRVSTPLILEVVRKVMYKDEDIDGIYESFCEENNSLVINENPKQKAIMTVCATGKGTSIMLKGILSNILKETGNTEIQVVPINYIAVESNSKEYKDLRDRYDIIACLGNIKPKIDVPFFPMQDMLSKDSRYKLYRFIEMQTSDKVLADTKSSYETARAMLEDFLLYLNPKKAVSIIEIFINTLNLNGSKSNDSFITNFTIHLGCMLERIITGNKVIFDNLDKFKSNYKSEFYQVRQAIKILEEKYNVEITDNEIAYILQVINNRQQ